MIGGAEDRFLNLFARLQGLFPFMPLAGADTLPAGGGRRGQAVVSARCNSRRAWARPTSRGPLMLTLREIVQLAGRLTGNERR